MSLYCGTFFRRKSFWCYRLLSTYVTKTRYLFELKEDDEACRRAQQTGAFYLFHDLDPLLQASGHRYLAPRLSRAELEGLLGKFGQDSQRIEDSVLIGCSSQREAWFALDLGLSGASFIGGRCLFLVGASLLLADFRVLCNTISRKILHIQKIHQLFSLNKTPLSTIITMKLSMAENLYT